MLLSFSCNPHEGGTVGSAAPGRQTVPYSCYHLVLNCFRNIPCIFWCFGEFFHHFQYEVQGVPGNSPGDIHYLDRHLDQLFSLIRNTTEFP